MAKYFCNLLPMHGTFRANDDAVGGRITWPRRALVWREGAPFGIFGFEKFCYCNCPGFASSMVCRRAKGWVPCSWCCMAIIKKLRLSTLAWSQRPTTAQAAAMFRSSPSRSLRESTKQANNQASQQARKPADKETSKPACKNKRKQKAKEPKSQRAKGQKHAKANKARQGKAEQSKARWNAWAWPPQALICRPGAQAPPPRQGAHAWRGKRHAEKASRPAWG